MKQNNPAEDHSLWQKCRKDDINAFETLFRKYYANLSRYALALVRDAGAAEEIAQDFFSHLWEKRQQLEIKQAVSSYFYQAVRNRCLNHFRRSKRLDVLDDGLPLPAVPEPDIAFQDLQQALRQAIAGLPERCREIFLLSREQNLSYREIAEKLHLSIKTVENQISIALEKLRKELQPFLLPVLAWFFVNFLKFLLEVFQRCGVFI